MKTKLNSLDALRAAACIAILSYHMYLSYLGYWGVVVFFVLSAFLMTYNSLDRPVFEKPSLTEGIRFSLKKTAKLYPLHLLTFAFPFFLQVFAILTGRMEAGSDFAAKAAANVFLLQSLCPRESWYYSFNYSSWFLSSLGIIYLFFPLILRCIRKYRSNRSACLAIALTFVCQPLLVRLLSGLVPMGDFSVWISHICPLIRLGDYIIGCNLAYLYVHRGEKTLSVGKATALELFAVLLTAAAVIAFRRSLLPDAIKNDTVYLPAAALFIWCFAGGEGFLSRTLNGRAARFIARLSPFVFLLHTVVIQFVSILLERIPIDYQLKRLCFCLLVPSVTFALAELYRRVAEKRKARKTV